MGTVTWQYTVTGTEAHPSVFFTEPFPAFTGDFQVSANLSSPAQNIYNFGYAFQRHIDTTSCWSEGISFVAGDQNKVGSYRHVNDVPSYWPCLNWDTFVWSIGPDTSMPPAGMVITVSVTGTYINTTGYCQYGTERQPTAQATTYLTPAIVSALLTAVSMEPLAAIFDGLWFSTLNVDELCSTLPPQAPTWDLSTLNATAMTIQTLFQNAAWPYFCQCKAGATTPVPPPSPTQPTPVGWPTKPVNTCDPNNICATLLAMQDELQVMQKMLQSNFELITLMQRYQLPFNYIEGAVHSNLSGEASFAISRLVGLKVEVTARDPGRKVLDSNPDYLWDLGWVSVSDQGGMLQSKRIARPSLVWLPPDCATATICGWHATPNTVIRITELEAEP